MQEYNILKAFHNLTTELLLGSFKFVEEIDEFKLKDEFAFCVRTFSHPTTVGVNDGHMESEAVREFTFDVFSPNLYPHKNIPDPEWNYVENGITFFEERTKDAITPILKCMYVSRHEFSDGITKEEIARVRTRVEKLNTKQYNKIGVVNFLGRGRCVGLGLDFFNNYFIEQDKEKNSNFRLAINILNWVCRPFSHKLEEKT